MEPSCIHNAWPSGTNYLPVSNLKTPRSAGKSGKFLSTDSRDQALGIACTAKGASSFPETSHCQSTSNSGSGVQRAVSSSRKVKERPRCKRQENSDREGRTETRKFDERPKGVGRGKSRRAGRERSVGIGGTERANGGVGVRAGGLGEGDGGRVGPAKTRYAKQAANLNGPAQNECPHLVLRSLVSSLNLYRSVSISVRCPLALACPSLSLSLSVDATSRAPTLR